MQERLEWLENNGYTTNGVVNNTKTTTFLMPLIGISELSINFLHPRMLINAHIKSKEDKLIYIILNKLDSPEESRDYVLLQNLNEHFVDYIEEEQEYILIYQLPKHFNKDYELILQGKYSQTSVPYKEIMLRVYGIQNNSANHLSTVHDVLYPTDVKRQQYADFLNVEVMLIEEVCSRPKLQYEVYKTIDQLKEDYGN
jgi:hypothetical protein